MSTWISDIGLLGCGLRGLAPVLALGACVAGVPGGGDQQPRPAPRSITVADGVTIIGPAGYCVDQSAARDGAEGAFVLLGSCAALSGNPSAAKPARPALLTASVTPAGEATDALTSSFPEMAQFFRSSAGRAALSRSGRADTVTLGQVVSVQDVMLIRASDTSAAEGQPVEAEYWRAILAIEGHIVTLSVLGLHDRPMAAGDKRKLLESFIAKLRAANP